MILKILVVIVGYQILLGVAIASLMIVALGIAKIVEALADRIATKNNTKI